VALAGDDQRVEDRRTSAGIGVADKQPVAFANRRGPDGVFDPIIVDSGVPMAHMLRQRLPLIDQVGTGLRA
jgi:hypothetical protein